jgi:hypothetical protein
MLKERMPFVFVDMAIDTVKIRELSKHRVVDIHFRKTGVTCSVCNTDMCEHVLYALSVPVVQKEAAKKIKQGWNIPELDL